jgi:hypothetical protein
MMSQSLVLPIPYPLQSGESGHRRNDGRGTIELGLQKELKRTGCRQVRDGKLSGRLRRHAKKKRDGLAEDIPAWRRHGWNDVFHD